MKGKKMGKAINVKVSTAKVIDALEAALAVRKKKFTDFENAQKEYEKKWTDFQKSIVKNLAKAKVENVAPAYSYRHDNANDQKVEITVSFPKGTVPTRPEFEGVEWKIKGEIEELENAIKLLRMTDESVVSTSTYSKVANYI